MSFITTRSINTLWELTNIVIQDQCLVRVFQKPLTVCTFSHNVMGKNISKNMGGLQVSRKQPLCLLDVQRDNINLSNVEGNGQLLLNKNCTLNILHIVENPL